MSIDPVSTDANTGKSFNRYVYANNSPYKYIDPDGRTPLLLAVPVVVGAVVGGGLNAAFQYYDTGHVRWGGLGGVLDAAGDGAMFGTMGLMRASPSGIAQARVARDELAAELKPAGGKAPATVTAGVNTRTGEIAAKACGGGKCAEDHVVDALGGNKAEVKFTEATRPRTGQQVPVCERCEGKYGKDSFPKDTKFKSDEKK